MKGLQKADTIFPLSSHLLCVLLLSFVLHLIFFLYCFFAKMDIFLLKMSVSMCYPVFATRDFVTLQVQMYVFLTDFLTFIELTKYIYMCIICLMQILFVAF